MNGMTSMNMLQKQIMTMITILLMSVVVKPPDNINNDAMSNFTYGVQGFMTPPPSSISYNREKQLARRGGIVGAANTRRIRIAAIAPSSWSNNVPIDPKGMPPDYPFGVTRMIITIGSCYLTWYVQLSSISQYSNVLASSAITLICSIVFDKRLGQAAFCGTFAGMCSTSVIPTKNLALIVGAVSSLLYELIIHNWNMFVGIGGRLGLTAFIATSIVTSQTNNNIRTGLRRYALFGLGGSKIFKLSTLNINKTLIPMAIWYAIGAIGTIIMREVSDDTAAADPIRASAVVGLTGALLLHDKTAALAVYGGSFVGMSLPSKLMAIKHRSSSPSLLSKTKNIFSILFSFGVSGAIGGIIHGATINWKLWSGGWGGKSGTCAFLGCIVYRTISWIINRWLRVFQENDNYRRRRRYFLKPD